MGPLAARPGRLPEQVVGLRTVLRRLRLCDAEPLFALIERDRERLARFLPWVPDIGGVAQERNFLVTVQDLWEAGAEFHYGLQLPLENVLVGALSVHGVDWDAARCYLGYWIALSHEGRGLVREALALIEPELARASFREVRIRCHPDNERSRALALRAGFRQAGTDGEGFVQFVKALGPAPSKR